MNSDDVISSSALTVLQNGVDVSGKVLTINLDDKSTIQGYLTFKASHLTSKGKVNTDYIFTYECEGITFTPYGDGRFETSINLASLDYIGVFNIRVKSSYTSNYDMLFTLNLVSSLTDINVNYNILPEYESDKYALTPKMKSGTITSFTNEITLARGAEYTLTAVPINESATIGSIRVNSSDTSVAYSRNVYKESATLVLVGGKSNSAVISVVVGYSNIKRVFNVNIKDVSGISWSEKDTESIQEDIISLINGDEKTYELTINAPSDKKVMFTLDGEIINQEHYYDNSTKNYIPPINKDALWWEQSTLLYKYKDEVYFSVKVNNDARTFTIRAYKETVFNFKNENLNLHAYLYVKYDDDLSYRWKIRIMVGGVIEGIRLYVLDTQNSEEEALDDDIVVKEGSAVGWLFRARFIPSTYGDNDLYFYIADTTLQKKYTINGKEITLPSPSGDSVNSEYNSSLTLSSENNNRVTIGENLTLYKSAYFERNLKGYHDLYTTYNNMGFNIKLVCINPSSGLWTSVNIRSEDSNGLYIKSLRMLGNDDYTSLYTSIYPLDEYVTVLKGSTTSETVSLKTNYSKGDTVQEFPKTVQNGIKDRMFFIQRNGSIEITLNATFDIKSVSLSYSNDAKKVLSSVNTSVDALNPHTATIEVNTSWHDLSLENKKSYISLYKEKVKQMFLTPSSGVVTYLKIYADKTTYTVPLRFVVFD